MQLFHYLALLNIVSKVFSSIWTATELNKIKNPSNNS